MPQKTLKMRGLQVFFAMFMLVSFVAKANLCTLPLEMLTEVFVGPTFSNEPVTPMSPKDRAAGLRAEIRIMHEGIRVLGDPELGWLWRNAIEDFPIPPLVSALPIPQQRLYLLGALKKAVTEARERVELLREFETISPDLEAINRLCDERGTSTGIANWLTERHQGLNSRLSQMAEDPLIGGKRGRRTALAAALKEEAQGLGNDVAAQLAHLRSGKRRGNRLLSRFEQRQYEAVIGKIQAASAEAHSTGHQFKKVKANAIRKMAARTGEDPLALAKTITQLEEKTGWTLEPKSMPLLAKAAVNSSSSLSKAVRNYFEMYKTARKSFYQTKMGIERDIDYSSDRDFLIPMTALTLNGNRSTQWLIAKFIEIDRIGYSWHEQSVRPPISAAAVVKLLGTRLRKKLNANTVAMDFFHMSDMGDSAPNRGSISDAVVADLVDIKVDFSNANRERVISRFHEVDDRATIPGRGRLTDAQISDLVRFSFEHSDLDVPLIMGRYQRRVNIYPHSTHTEIMELLSFEAP